MAPARFSRREQARFWRKAQAAKAGGDFGKSQIDVPFDVLGEHGCRLYFIDDPFDLGPQVARIIPPAALPGKAERLARITGSEDMNAVAPWLAVEGCKIVPDRCLIQRRVCHPRHKSGRRMGFPLDVTHSAVSRFGDGQAKVDPAISGAQGKPADLLRGLSGKFGT